MNVEQAVLVAQHQASGSVLVARPPFTWGADAMYTELAEDYRIPPHILDAGFKYLLGVDDLLKIVEFLRTKKISSKAAAEFVLHCATMDCEPAWIHDIPSH